MEGHDSFNKYSANLSKNYQWTEKEEAKYKESQSQARVGNLERERALRRTELRRVGSATFADCALASFVYTYINTSTTQQQRGELLEK